MALRIRQRRPTLTCENDPVLTHELIPYLKKRKRGPLMPELVASLRREKMRTIDFLVEVNQHIHHRIKYLIRMKPGVQTPERTLRLGSGSCRDSAWLMVQLFRQLGLAARFVSGYLIQLTPDVKSLDGPSGAEKDFTDLHAWTEVYLPGAGWVGLDATSGLFVGEGHIPLACSADPVTAAAVTGSFSYDDESIVTAEPDDEAREKDRVKDGVRIFHVRHAHSRRPARHQAVLGRAVDRDRIARASGGRRPESE